MRKLALLTMALLGLALADNAFAQGSQAGPQPGLPPGAGIGAPNALTPRATGQIATTPTGPAVAAMPYEPPARPMRRRVRRHRTVHHMRHGAPASAAAPAAQ